MRFSVLLPTHYRPDVLGYAIRSVLAQTEPDFELLVVGDGAVAGTAEVVSSFDDPRIRWFDLPKGPGFGYDNRNVAMAAAAGRLIAHMSDDDIMLPDHLALLGTAFDDPKVQWAYSQALWVSTDGIAAPDLTNLDFDDERQFFEKRSNSISGTVFAYRREAFASHRPWPEDISRNADWVMMKTLLAHHGKQAMARISSPTMLHFTAGTKDSRHSHFALLEGWLRLADSANWWPEELRKDPLTAIPPQAAYLERLQGEPGFVARLRRAAADVTARAALDRLVPRLVPRTDAQHVDALVEQALRLKAELAALKGDRRKWQRRVRKLQGSLSWRLTRPLRAIQRLFRPRKP